MSGLVQNPVSSLLGDGAVQTNNVFGKQGDQLNSDLHGKYYVAASRGKVFKFNVTAKTVPVIANNLASVFTLWNPAASGVMAEIITTEIGQVLATTVVDTLAWYFQGPTATAQIVTSTAAVANTTLFSARIGETPSNGVGAFTALTHVGTPVRVDMVAAFGAVTDAGSPFGAVVKAHDGALILLPGYAISLAMSTAAGTASGLDLGVTWAEFPFHSV